MKKNIFLFLFVLLLCTINFVSAKEDKTDLRLLGKVIYLDSGHGGVDPGTIYKDIYEKNINLEITLKLKEQLEKEGAIVYLTRDGDYDLSSTTINRKRSDLLNRAIAINKSNADIYISIHLNSIQSSTWYGGQVFYDDINPNNKIIANIIQKKFKDKLKSNREVKKINNMLMNRKIKIPGVLVEAGFLSNPNERYLLQKSEYQYKISETIKEGIIEYFK